MWNGDVYGNPMDIYDNMGWHKHFAYDSPSLPGSPNEIDYFWKGTDASFMRTTMSHDTARRMTSYKNEMFKRRDYYTYDTNGLLQSPGGIASLDASQNLGIVMLKSRYQGWPGWPYFTETGNLTFSRDTSGLITGITGDKEFNANYDPDLQISSINHILPQPFAEGYAYDDNGNRLSSLTNSYNYDDLNRLTNSATHDYTYDADGIPKGDSITSCLAEPRQSDANLIQEKNKLTSETKKYYYDAEIPKGDSITRRFAEPQRSDANRMIKYEHQVSDMSLIDITATYKYDIFGRRLQKDVNGSTNHPPISADLIGLSPKGMITNFFWENDTMTYELICGYQDGCLMGVFLLFSVLYIVTTKHIY